MNIIGINGWFARSHDASACLVSDGEIIAFIEEERLTRYRHAFEQLPYRAIEYCLNKAKLSPNDVDIISIGWDYHLKYKMRNIELPPYSKDLLNLYFPRKLFNRKRDPEIEVVDHHLAHASSVYRASGYKNSAILVVDGQGEYCAISIWEGRNYSLEKKLTLPIDVSLGYFFEAINKALGFSYFDSGKTMGLSGYGKNPKIFHEFQLNKNDIQVNLLGKVRMKKSCLDEQEQLIGLWRDKIIKKFKFNEKDFFVDSSLRKIFSSKEKMIALSAQKTLEKVMLHLVKIAHDIVGGDHLCIVGGVALNCNANTAIAKSKIYKHIHIVPITNDSGVSLGAALETQFNRTGIKGAKLNPFLGPEFSDMDIERALIKYKLSFKKVTNIAKVGANFIANGKIIAWFQGRLEIGPRALGNRSILADPRQKEISDRVNNIKNRELWRPFAPSVMAEYSEEFFEEKLKSPYMLYTFKIKDKYKKIIPAVCHIDGSSRPQTVTSDSNGLFWRLLNEFRKITGIPLVLNTSFNGPGEPIVCSPEDAIKMFLRAKIDILIIGNYVVEKI